MLTHLDDKNNPKMVNVAGKDLTLRKATAQSIVDLPESISLTLSNGEIQTKKGPLFQTAIIAGTMAAKKTWDLIPLCHPLALEGCDVDIYLNDEGFVVIQCTVSVSGKTGVEMEALTGASVAALTIYDMCKSMSHDIVIKETKLLEKTGGKSDYKEKQ
jgi:cyclic pyranopterin monophosphate synthase